MKKLLFLLPFCVAAAAAEDVVYDFFSQNRNVLTTNHSYTWGADAQGHSGALQLGYKNAERPTGHNASITDRTLTWTMDDYNQAYLRFDFDEITLSTDQQMKLLFDVTLQAAAKDSLGNVEAYKTSLVSLGITNVGVGSNAGAGLSAMTTGEPAEGYSNVINNPKLTMGSDYALQTFNFVTTYHFDGVQWVADLTMTNGADTWTQTVNLGDSLTVDHLYVSLDGHNWEYGMENGNNTSQISNLKLIVSAAAPEPATATLSLLALAGLAARRRRK